MKKNKFLGILLILVMVLALALLAGCGHKDESNAGATDAGDSYEQGEGYGDPDDNKGDGKEQPDDGGAEDNKTPMQDADGNYVYTINNFGLSMEIHTCVNVWDYIYEGYPYDTVDLKGMMEDLGWDSSGEWGTAGYGVYTRSDGYMVRMIPERADSSYKLSTGEYRVGSIWVRPYKTRDLELHCWVATSEGTVEHPYIVEGSFGNGYVSFDQIVVFAKYYDHYREDLDEAIEFPVGWYKRLIP